ncbi:hypothetical protein T439DRAFT_326899, partial [Meredithblackwellia eburnea MCA 4105]
MFRAALRSTTPAFKRGYSAAAGEVPFVAERAHVKEHAAKSGELWRKITYFFAFPAIVAGYYNAERIAAHHHEHFEHIKAENGGEAPERIVYTSTSATRTSLGAPTLFSTTLTSTSMSSPLPRS